MLHEQRIPKVECNTDSTGKPTIEVVPINLAKRIRQTKIRHVVMCIHKVSPLSNVHTAEKE